MGLEFQVEDDKVCYAPLKEKCKAIQNLDSPKNIERDKSFLWHGQFPLFIFTRSVNITHTNVQFAKEIQEI